MDKKTPENFDLLNNLNIKSGVRILIVSTITAMAGAVFNVPGITMIGMAGVAVGAGLDTVGYIASR